MSHLTQERAAMSGVVREVTWGEGLVVETFRTHGGLRAVVEAIIAEVGPTVGTRNTFAKLLRVEDPGTLSPRDRWRAWLLLAALGQEPGEWAVDDSNAPPSVDVEALKSALQARVRRQGFEPRTQWFGYVSLAVSPLALAS